MADAAIMVVLLCAGQSSRLGGAIAKPWLMLEGKPVMRHAIDAFAGHPRISGGVVVVAEGAEDHARANLPHDGGNWLITTGGSERSQSVRYGLERLSDVAPQWVLIHDAARPFVPHTVLDRLIAALDEGAEAVIPTLPPADSLKKVSGGVVTERVPRDGIERVQTPQAFSWPVILRLHQANSDPRITDDAALAEDAGIPVLAVEGDPVLAKITNSADLAIAERIAFALREGDTAPMMKTSSPDIRMATGYDVHRFNTDPGPIMLGGIEIAHDHGFDAHSDGDVALHALTDAIFGVMADGDIGAHFPPSDDQWKGMDSAFFLEKAAAQLAEQGGVITLADLTIIAEAPKITPHRDAMRARIAGLLGLAVDRVSVKATTSEGLGFTGRKEGIAVQAAVTAVFGPNNA